MGNAPSKSSPQVQNDTLDSTYCDKSGWMPVGTFDSDKVRTLYEILSEIRDRGDRLFKAIDRKLMIKYRNQWKLGSLTVSKQSEELREGMALRGWMYRLDVVMVGDNGWHKGKQKKGCLIVRDRQSRQSPFPVVQFLVLVLDQLKGNGTAGKGGSFSATMQTRTRFPNPNPNLRTSKVRTL